jgi:DNA-binding transcriptional regulator YiaG
VKTPGARPGRPSQCDRIADLLRRQPSLTNQQIAERLGCRANTVNDWRRKIAAAEAERGA